MSLYKDVMGAKVENWKQLHNLILSHRQILTHDICRQKVSEPEDLPEHGVTVVFVELPNTKGWKNESYSHIRNYLHNFPTNLL